MVVRCDVDVSHFVDIINITRRCLKLFLTLNDIYDGPLKVPHVLAKVYVHVLAAEMFIALCERNAPEQHCSRLTMYIVEHCQSYVGLTIKDLNPKKPKKPKKPKTKTQN